MMQVRKLCLRNIVWLDSMCVQVGPQVVRLNVGPVGEVSHVVIVLRSSDSRKGRNSFKTSGSGLVAIIDPFLAGNLRDASTHSKDYKARKTQYYGSLAALSGRAGMNHRSAASPRIEKPHSPLIVSITSVTTSFVRSALICPWVARINSPSVVKVILTCMQSSGLGSGGFGI